MSEPLGSDGARVAGVQETALRWALAFLLVGVLGCPAGSSSGSTDAVDCLWDGVPAEPSGAGGTVTESQVFLDLSWTMRGFISEGEGGRPVTLQQELLRTILLEALGNADVTPPTLWGFGREVFPLEESLSAYAAREGGGVEPRELYDQAETDVVATLLAASEQPSALSVILTDNAQDLRTAKERRAPGFDRSAMIRALTQELAEKGFGVWLVGFRNDFRGAYFSILLAANSHGVHVNKPIPLASEQPLYAWVISKDLAKGRAVVDDLVRELRRRWAVRNEEGQPPVHAIELAPGAPPRVEPREPLPEELEIATGEDAPFSGPDPQRDLLRVRDWEVVEGDVPRAEATLRFQRPRGADLLFLLKVQLDGDPERPEWGTWPYSAWNLQWRQQPDGRGPQVQVAQDLSPFSVQPEARTRFRKLVLPLQQVTAYEPERRRIQIPLSVAFGVRSIPADHWVRAWSTDDDTTQKGIEGKTLYLSDVTGSVLEKTIGREQPGACIDLTLVEE